MEGTQASGGAGGGVETGGSGGSELPCPDCEGTVLWEYIAGPGGDQRGLSLAVDPLGAIVLGAAYTELFDVGGMNDDGDAFGDAMVLHFVPGSGAAPTLAWAVQLRSGDADPYPTLLGVAAPQGGGALTAVGNFKGTVQSDGHEFASGLDVDEKPWFAQYDANGQMLSGYGFGGPTGVQSVDDVALFEDGTIAVVGHHSEPGAVLGTPVAGLGTDTFIAAFEGSNEWVTEIGGPGAVEPRRVRAVGASSIVVLGEFDMAIRFVLSAPEPSKGGTDLFLVSYNLVTDRLFALTLGGEGDDSPGGLVVDSNLNIYASFVFTESFSAGDVTWTANGTRTIGWVKLAATGEIIGGGTVAHQTSDNRLDAPALGIDSRGNLVIGGTFDGEVVFDDNSQQVVSPTAFVLKTSPQGTIHYTRVLGGDSPTSSSELNDLVVVGDVTIVTGSFVANINLGLGLRQSGGGADLFMAAFGL